MVYPEGSQPASGKTQSWTKDFVRSPLMILIARNRRTAFKSLIRCRYRVRNVLYPCKGLNNYECDLSDLLVNSHGKWISEIKGHRVNISGSKAEHTAASHDSLGLFRYSHLQVLQWRVMNGNLNIENGSLSTHTPQMERHHKQLLINGLPKIFLHQDRHVFTINLMLEWTLSLFPDNLTSGAPAEISHISAQIFYP